MNSTQAAKFTCYRALHLLQNHRVAGRNIVVHQGRQGVQRIIHGGRIVAFRARSLTRRPACRQRAHRQPL